MLNKSREIIGITPINWQYNAREVSDFESPRCDGCLSLPQDHGYILPASQVSGGRLDVRHDALTGLATAFPGEHHQPVSGSGARACLCLVLTQK
jgi:hypothetical protein